ncbi:hypothetical protein HZH68_007633 [Vespula germanica]|uniref:Uncharacterized protein n=1 Tax=Vespula germanica TaxID=30212 RepID=A0A834K7X9_VESGE|nr:hypothetical protein HZH68_007633 [Vespula germanica]
MSWDEARFWGRYWAKSVGRLSKIHHVAVLALMPLHLLSQYDARNAEIMDANVCSCILGQPAPLATTAVATTYSFC